MRKQILPRDMPWVDAQGRPTDLFYDLIADMLDHTLTKPVSVTEPANTEVLIYNSTSGKYEPGAN